MSEVPTRTIAVTLAYDGTRYVGWQRQPAGQSIQGLLESAIAAIDPGDVKVTGAGRTDAGVHAIGQVASFVLSHPVSCTQLPHALNARLPVDVRVLRAEEREPGFNARYSATSKRYRYVLVPARIADPFDARFAWHVPVPLDATRMTEALAPLVGRHDFAAFCGAGSDAAGTERTLLEASCRTETADPSASWRPTASAGSRIVIEVRGDGFLRHMVRNIVGTLVEVGKGRWPAATTASLIAGRDRRDAGPTAPAHGLCLVDVRYGEPGPERPLLSGAATEG
jgi:tRNA pseudouridine38-40 synthase